MAINDYGLLGHFILCSVEVSTVSEDGAGKG